MSICCVIDSGADLFGGMAGVLQAFIASIS